MCFICLSVSERNILQKCLFHQIPLGYALISHTTPPHNPNLLIHVKFRIFVWHLSFVTDGYRGARQHPCWTYSLHCPRYQPLHKRKKENPFCLLLYLCLFQGKSPIIINTAHRSNIIYWHFILDAREETLNNCLSKTQYAFSFAHTLFLCIFIFSTYTPLSCEYTKIWAKLLHFWQEFKS